MRSVVCSSVATVLGDPNVTAFLKALSLHRFCSVFNLYSNDLPVTRGRKFIYADDICLAIQGQYLLQRTGMQSLVRYGADVTLLSTLDIGDLNQAPPKQSAVCSTCIIPAPPVNCQFIWMTSAFGMSATQKPNLSWGDSRPYAVLQRTLDKDYRQAEEPKQLVDEASRFHLGRQRQYSAVICSGALLFSSRVLRPSLVTLCSHKSGRCAVELYHAYHLWYPPFYTSPMASSALQH